MYDIYELLLGSCNRFDGKDTMLVFVIFRFTAIWLITHLNASTYILFTCVLPPVMLSWLKSKNVCNAKCNIYIQC